ncbi:YfgM family protein [Thiocapsa bogorovii]|uniref:YfgM family protein n=1 Tax=Thiocapsa bogorovii TaxID=521689 RepID=UPI001E3F89AB|nr:tetratricopeptide repeat protein [Thiocapsa bogorovii]UHD14843.1 tetratricopeptide repeat protein [Thiocapsa bogorovii]
MSYETDDEKVEAIKAWWKENGVAIVMGIAIGLGAIVGWRYWGDYRDSVAAQGSTVFDQVLANAATGQTEAVVTQARMLNEDFSSTPYAALGKLVEAKALYESGQAEAAMTALTGVINDAPDPAMARIAALRLARIQVAEGKLDDAEKTVADHDTSPEFAGDFAAVQGDIAAARGDTVAARKAYERALAEGTGFSQLLRLKLDNLPAAG